MIAVRTFLRAAPLAAALVLLAASLHAQAPRRVRALPVDTAGRNVRICAGGDVTVGTNLDTMWTATARRRYGVPFAAYPDPDSMLAPLRRMVAGADVVLLNVEGAIGTGPVRRKCAPGSTRCFAFRQQPEVAGALRRVAPDSADVVGNVANNHAGDAGPAGWRQTARRLREAGVHVTGNDTLATPVVTHRGDTVAVLGFAPWIGPDPRDLAAVRRHVGRAARRWRRVVVTMHMGAEGARAQRTPNAPERAFGESRGNSVAFARTAVAAGADLVIGHGPHVLRAAEWRDSALVVYSLGNLLTYGPFTNGEPLNRGALACADLEPSGRIAGAWLLPTRQLRPGTLVPDPSARALTLVDSLGRLDFPVTGARVAPDGQLRRPEPPPRLKGVPVDSARPDTARTASRRPPRGFRRTGS